jgi:PAS domain S-box-containing protein
MTGRDDARQDAVFEHHQLAMALAAARVGVWTWDSSSDRLRWSPETALLFGLPSGSVAGKLEDLQSRMHPEDRPRVLEAIRRALARDSDMFEVVYRIGDEPGEPRWVLGRGRVTFDAAGRVSGMLGAVVDVSAERRASEQIRLSEERYRLFTEMASDYVYQVDVRAPQLAPQIVAGSFERTTGYTPEEIATLGGWLQVMHPDDRAAAPEVTAALRAGRPFVNEYRILTKHGKERWLRDRGQPILDRETGALVQIVGGVQDITERKQLELQLGHAQKLDALARLAGSVAHDFNNLLTVMMGECELLTLELGEAGTGETFATLRRSFEQAAELTASLLAFARRRPALRENVRVADALAQVAPVLTRALGERIRVSLESGAGDALIAVDRAQLDTALLNIALNARAAMPDGGRLRITTRIEQIPGRFGRQPTDLPRGAYIAIAIAIAGCGMSAEVLTRVFEPFFTTKAGRGTGLGLSTVYGVIRQFGGAVVAESALGQGSTFTIFLPVAHGEVGEVQREVTRPSIGGNERIVLVDDDPAVLNTVGRILTDLGYEVSSFSTAEDVLAHERALQSCQLLLTDVRLPGASGLALAEHCAQRHPGVKILLTSGYVEDPAHAAIIESGELAFLHKPLAPESLARRVRSVLDG